jgi:hypothetical protein
MRPDLTEKLINDFPILYGLKTANSPYASNVPTTFSIYKFEHDDGWEPIIRELSGKLEAYNQQSHAVVQVTQCKEKFGTLCFYVSVYTPYSQNLIREAEAKSAETCEMCGQAGTLGSKGWIRTLCDPCRLIFANRPLDYVNPN